MGVSRKPATCCLRGPVGDQGRGARGAHQPFGGKVIGVGITGAVAGAHADSATCANSLAGGFNQRLVDRNRGRRDRFEVEVGKIAAGGERLAQAPFDETPGQSKPLEEVELMLRKVHRRPARVNIHHIVILVRAGRQVNSRRRGGPGCGGLRSQISELLGENVVVLVVTLFCFAGFFGSLFGGAIDLIVLTVLDV